MSEENQRNSIKDLPRNIWAVGLTSFFMDISSEMVINILPLFLSNVLGVKTDIIGLIEGVAEATASIIKVFSAGFPINCTRVNGWLWWAMDYRRYPSRSSISQYLGWVAGVRWWIGSAKAFVPHRATHWWQIRSPRKNVVSPSDFTGGRYAGAMLGILIALLLVWMAQSSTVELGQKTFQTVVLASLIPAFLAVLSLAIGVKEIKPTGERAAPKFAFKKLGKPFMTFMIIVGIFDLGNSSDAFLVLRAQERGISVMGILGLLAVFNLVYTLVSTPAGSLSDKVGRRNVIIGGWIVYALVYLGFGLANAAWQIWMLYIVYGLYYGMAYGTSNAMVADLVSEDMLGTAYGTYNAILGILDFPASLIAGFLWEGVGSWQGFGPSAPFLFGSALAMLAVILFIFWKPSKPEVEMQAEH
jgi:hypothetical protein